MTNPSSVFLQMPVFPLVTTSLKTLDNGEGLVFERIVAQALKAGLMEDELGPLDELGSWWSRDGKTQLDLLARYGDRLLLLECKWRADKTLPIKALSQLKDHASRFPVPKGIHQILYGLASAGHLPRPLRHKHAAGSKNLSPLLIGPADLLP